MPKSASGKRGERGFYNRRLALSPHISFVIPSLGPGGAERVLVRLAHHWAGYGFRLSIITLESKSTSFYRLPLAAHWIGLGVGGETCGLGVKIGANLRRIKILRQIFDRLRPDVIISFLPETNVLVLLANFGRTARVIVTEHSDPRILPRAGTWRLSRMLLYPLANRVVSVSPGIDNYFQFLPKRLRRVIPNAVDLKEIANSRPTAFQTPWPHAVAAMGRLAPEKGFDLLLTAFAPLALRQPEWGLVILGEGPLRQDLETLTKTLGITAQALLPGALQEPYGVLKQAEIFAFPSYFEGFGIAVVEAMACGLPVVASDCRPGPGELITPNADGILVPRGNITALRQALELLMTNPDLRSRLGSAARETASQYDLPKVMQKWDDLLLELLPASQKTCAL